MVSLFWGAWVYSYSVCILHVHATDLSFVVTFILFVVYPQMGGLNRVTSRRYWVVLIKNGRGGQGSRLELYKSEDQRGEPQRTISLDSVSILSLPSFFPLSLSFSLLHTFATKPLYLSNTSLRTLFYTFVCTWHIYKWPHLH